MVYILQKMDTKAEITW